MEILNLVQGSPEWAAYRAQARNASDVPAMLGISPYKTRADLIRERATGIAPEITPEQQRIFDRGHRIEALARPEAENTIGEDLSPCVGTDGQYSASFDGITFGGEAAWECKSDNAALRAAIPYALCDDSYGAKLPEHYRAQMEQQAMVSGCERILFTAASLGDDGQISQARHCWYTPDPAMRARIVAGWEQFDRDVAAWTPEPVTQAPIGHAPETLPALRLVVTGAVTASNLDEFREHALTVIGAINRDLKTDADFADAEKTVKWCADAEARLKAAKDAALAQTESIEQAFRVIDDVTAELRRTRLDLDKLVKAEKDARKLAIVQNAQAVLHEHVEKLNRDLRAKQAGTLPPAAPVVFAACVKGLKSLDSMTEKVTAELIRLKAEATETAMRMLSNRDILRSDGHDWSFLFPDFAAVGAKSTEDFAALAHMRISQHKQAEAERLEKERQRIESEAKAKAEREAQATAEAERARIRAEEQAKAQAEAAVRAAEQVAARQAAEGPTADAVRKLADDMDAPITHQPAAKTGERITLGHINALLAPIKLDAAGIEALGFHVTRVRAAVHFQEAQFPALLARLVQHIHNIHQTEVV